MSTRMNVIAIDENFERNEKKKIQMTNNGLD